MSTELNRIYFDRANQIGMERGIGRIECDFLRVECPGITSAFFQGIGNTSRV